MIKILVHLVFLRSLLSSPQLLMASYLTPLDIIHMQTQSPTAAFHYGKEAL
jgi:hypothetical protein